MIESEFEVPYANDNSAYLAAIEGLGRIKRMDPEEVRRLSLSDQLARLRTLDWMRSTGFGF